MKRQLYSRCFLQLKLYFETVRLLKNCIKSLTFVSVLAYLIKLFISTN